MTQLTYKQAGLFGLLLLAGCARPRQEKKAVVPPAPETVFTAFNQIPAPVRGYLDSIEQGKFLIAAPGEQWSAGCTRLAGEPDKQFIQASLQADTFRMRYWQGGIARMQCQMVLLMRDGKVQGRRVLYQ